MNFDTATILNAGLFEVERRGLVVVPIVEELGIDLRFLSECGGEQKNEEKRKAIHSGDTIAAVSYRVSGKAVTRRESGAKSQLQIPRLRCAILMRHVSLEGHTRNLPWVPAGEVNLLSLSARTSYCKCFTTVTRCPPSEPCLTTSLMVNTALGVSSLAFIQISISTFEATGKTSEATKTAPLELTLVVYVSRHCTSPTGRYFIGNLSVNRGATVFLISTA
jgi:hypothetical protein